VAALALALVPTGGALGCRSTSRPAALPGEHVTSTPRDLELDVIARPRLDGTPRLELAITAKGVDLPRRWVVQRAWAGEEEVAGRIRDVRARCDGTPVEVTFDALETHLGWTLPGPCGEVAFSYAIPSEPRGLSWGYEFDVQVSAALTTAIAETALVLPDCPDETPVRVRVRFDLAGIQPDSNAPSAASSAASIEGVYSLGADRFVGTTTRAARHAFLAAGRFDRVEVPGDALSLDLRFGGAPRLDRAQAARDLGALARAEQALFADQTPETLHMLVIGVPSRGEEPAPHGTSLTASAMLWLDEDAPWSSQHARLAAHEMVHLYNGQVLRRAGKDAQTYWFSEGFTEFLADELMLRARVESAEAWLETLRLRVSAYYAHPKLGAPNAGADMGWTGDAASLPYLRGALVAALVDHAMRAKSAGRRSLDTLMRELLARARAGAPPMTNEALLDAIEAEVPPEVARAVRAVVIDGARLTLPPDVYGACVRVVPTGESATVRAADDVRDLEACVRR
jgi:hypothetical protein